MSNNPAAETFILLEVAGTTYAIRSHLIQQMEMVGNITPVPRAPRFVKGIVSVRGQVIPAVDLRARFGFPPAPYDSRTRLIVVMCEGRTVGLIADTAREFVRLSPGTIQPPPQAIAGLSGDYLEGVALLGERLVLILDPAAVLDAQLLAQVQADDETEDDRVSRSGHMLPDTAARREEG